MGKILLIVFFSAATVVHKNPLLQLKQAATSRSKRHYKKKNTSPAKKGASPLKRFVPENSPAKSSPSKTILFSPKHTEIPPDLKVIFAILKYDMK